MNIGYIVDWIIAHWSELGIAVLLALWLFKSWADGVLAEQLQLALAALVDLAKQYAGGIPKEEVLRLAYWLYDAEELLGIPDWLNAAYDLLKQAVLGSKEEFGEVVWELWLEFIDAQATVRAAGAV